MTATVERNQGRAVGRVPPHSREAEESVLGALLLSPHAANEVMDKLVPNDFYVPAHQSIFEAMVNLYNANQPIDAVTLSEELRRSGELEKVGGLAYLTHLVDVVPTASNVEYYAGIVEEHGLRRSLIKAGSSITELAFRTDDEVVVVIDRAEQEVLGVAEKRAGDGMLAIGPLFQEAIEHIEALEANGSEVTGLSTGFRDLDKKLAGLQKANLVVIAARPSMGKCLAEGSTIVDANTGARHKIEDLCRDRDLFATLTVSALDKSGRLIHAKPAAIADSGIKEVFRVRTRLGREVVASANHPLLTFEGWRRLDEVSVDAPIAVARTSVVEGSYERPDAEVALLGYLIGDGSVGAGVPSFTNTNPRVVADFTSWAVQMGAVVTSPPGSETYRVTRRRTTSQSDLARQLGVSSAAVSLALRSKSVSLQLQRAVKEAAAESDYRDPSNQINPVTELIEVVGLRGCTAQTKHVPDFIFRLSNRQIGLFLNRLYATDGSAWVSRGYYRIEYVSVSEQLAKDVQHLLLRLGISAKRRTRRVRYRDSVRVAWEVGIQDPIGVGLFSARVGIFGKEEQLDRVVEAASRRRHVRAHTELLPMEAWNVVNNELANRTWAEISTRSGRPRNHNWHVGTRRLSRRLMHELATALDSESLLDLSASDVIWDPIVSIESVGQRRTFDLEVPELENFVADDVIVHNSALTINIATFVAGTGKVVAIFSLEMAKEEVVQRILSSVGKVESSKLRTGQLGNQWDRLVAAANRMYKTPIYVDDSSVVTVTDIRAKCRRLKRIKGLDLVVVDYLQLMHGSSRENRQQEIAEISRGLKNLARELEVPIIAVSQLNRSVEQREDRRPRLSDLRECLTADTEILRSDNGQSITIGEIARHGLKNVPVWSLDASMKTVPSVMTEAWSTGVKPVFKIATASGRQVRATANHPFLTIDGWQQLRDLAPGDRIAVPRRIPEPISTKKMAASEIVFLGHMIGDGSYLPRQPLRYTSADPANHEAVSIAAQRRFGVEIKVNPLLDRSWQTRLVSPYRVTHGRRNPVCQWLDDLGIYGQRSPQKRLPQVLFGIPDEQVRGFLRHLWATDGSISVRTSGKRVGVYFASSSEGLARDVFHLLLRVDLQPRLVKVDQREYGYGWHVFLSGADVQRRFLTEIGCHGQRGEVIPKALDTLANRVANTNVDTIPVEIIDRIRDLVAKKGMSAVEVRRDLGSWQLQRKDPSRARVRLFADYLGDESHALFADSDILWDKITSIEQDGEEEVFDASVPRGHNFIASLVFAHNSGALEQDADVVVFIYRHEYYHPDDIEKRGTAEVIIAKHRAGATGTVEMTFMPDFTRFADLGRDLA